MATVASVRKKVDEPNQLVIISDETLARLAKATQTMSPTPSRCGPILEEPRPVARSNRATLAPPTSRGALARPMADIFLPPALRCRASACHAGGAFEQIALFQDCCSRWSQGGMPRHVTKRDVRSRRLGR